LADSILKRAGDALGFSKRGSATSTLGSTRTTGSIGSGEGAGTFDEPDRELNLVGQRRFDEFDRMVRDVSIVAAGVRLFLNLTSNAVWTVNPPEDLNENEKAVAQGYADQVYRELFGMTSSWSSIVRKTAAYRLYGFAIQEWTAKVNDDGSIGLKDIEHRPQKSIARWNRDEGGTVESVVQRVPGRADVPLPRNKIVYAVDDTLTDSPEGVGLFRHLAKTASRLETFLKLEEIGFTTDLRGIPVARAPLGELKAEVEEAGPPESEARARAEARRVALLAPLRNWLDKHVRNVKSAMLLPSDPYLATSVDKATTPSGTPKWALELLNGDSSSFEAMAAAVNRMNQELARILGTEHLLLGADGSGSLALARSKVGTFYLTVTSTLLDLCEIYDRDIIAPLADLNGWPEELRPQMGVNEISDRDIEQVADTLAKLANAGAPMMADDPAVGEIYDLLGLTRPEPRVDEMDLSLNPRRKEPAPADPDDDLEDNPEDGLTKVRVLRSRRNMAKARMRR
tara:strand:+ start:313 stop:1848 length:1536 start_codon:yes stop_codon:yes gene_type:complete